MSGIMSKKRNRIMLLAGVIAVLFAFSAGTASADMAAAKKWVDEEFQPSTLSKADRLLVIEDGRITEMGTHEELLRNPEGTYSRLCRMQQELHSIYVV